MIYAHVSSAKISAVFDEVKNSEAGKNYAYLIRKVHEDNEDTCNRRRHM